MKQIATITLTVEIDVPYEGLPVEAVKEIESWIQDRIESRDQDLFDLQDVEMESV